MPNISHICTAPLLNVYYNLAVSDAENSLDWWMHVFQKCCFVDVLYMYCMLPLHFPYNQPLTEKSCPDFYALFFLSFVSTLI